MKKSSKINSNRNRGLFCLLLLIFNISVVNSQKENDKVRQVINDYFNGSKTGNTDLIKKSFHSGCKLKHIKEDKTIYEADLNHFLNYLSENQGIPILTTQILKLDVCKNAANAKCSLYLKDYYYIDYLNLLKIDGEWKIVDKIYVRQDNY